MTLQPVPADKHIQGTLHFHPTCYGFVKKVLQVVSGVKEKCYFSGTNESRYV